MADKKYGRNKKWCEKYKNTGRRLINKEEKKKREEKKLERFKKRREEGKTYVYKPNPYDKDSKKRSEKRKYWEERRRREEKNNKPHKLPLAHTTSIMRRLQNRIDKETAALKAWKSKKTQEDVS